MFFISLKNFMLTSSPSSVNQLDTDLDEIKEKEGKVKKKKVLHSCHNKTTIMYAGKKSFPIG